MGNALVNQAYFYHVLAGHSLKLIYQSEDIKDEEIKPNILYLYVDKLDNSLKYAVKLPQYRIKEEDEKIVLRVALNDNLGEHTAEIINILGDPTHKSELNECQKKALFDVTSKKRLCGFIRAR